MKANDKYLKNENELKDKNKKLLEMAASRLAEIFVSQLEFNKNKNTTSNKYGAKSNPK